MGVTLMAGLKRTMTLSFTPVASPTAVVPPQVAITAPAMVGEGEKDLRRIARWVILWFLVLIGALLASLALFPDDEFGSRAATTPAAGLTIFAVFFVAAHGIERLIEPIAVLVPAETKQHMNNAVRDAQTLVNKLPTTPTDRPDDAKAMEAAKGAADEAARKKADHEVDADNRQIAFWALASVIGIIASAGLKLYLLSTVGIADPPRWAEVLATGLIIGGGTKPLHDLVEMISAKKDAARSAAALVDLA